MCHTASLGYSRLGYAMLTEVRQRSYSIRAEEGSGQQRQLSKYINLPFFASISLSLTYYNESSVSTLPAVVAVPGVGSTSVPVSVATSIPVTPSVSVTSSVPVSPVARHIPSAVTSTSSYGIIIGMLINIQFAEQIGVNKYH